MAGDFYAASANTPLRQCEIVCDLKQVVPTPAAAWAEQPDIEVIDHPFAVVLSQDCDLEQDFEARFTDNPELRLQIPSVLFCEAFLAVDKRQEPKMGDIWKQLTQNKLERFQYLAAVQPSEDATKKGFGPLVIDFKRYFCLPTPDVYKQFERGAAHRTLLSSPYLEQLSTRFCYYQYRVALPLQHHERTEPSK